MLGLKADQVTISKNAIWKMARNYTKEAGVRQLERKIGDFCRKVAMEILEKKKTSTHVTERNLEHYLGKELYSYQMANEEDEVGIVRGLAWTSVGGDTLQIEVNVMPGEGEILLTGQLGDVMKESARTGISYIRSVSKEHDIADDFFKKHDIHIHIPEGAVPKDGPSAGITMATAIMSAVTGRKVRADLAMTGEITLRGRVVRKKTGDLVMEHPEMFYPSAKYEEKLHTLQPVYGLTAGLSNNMVMKAMKQALDGLDLTREILPESLRLKYGLAEYKYAVRGIHYPEDKEVFYHARERLVFEEFLEFILSIRRLKEKNERLDNNYPKQSRPEVQKFLENLPFELTGAQQKVWKEIEKDLGSDKTMSRLVQGDVGSGKTIVAVLALMNAAFNGYQGAMMAPTEVLARQHYENITKMFEDYDIPITVELLTGSMTAKEKRRAYARIECGLAKINIGTHALIKGAVSYDNLGLVITDEQRRFGVKQRETFAL